MKLATLNNNTRDGELVVVSTDGERYESASVIVRCLQDALDDWETISPKLAELGRELHMSSGKSLQDAQVHSPLPRAYEWIDGSAYINHIVLVRQARGAEPPVGLRDDPLVYQGGSGHLLAPTADIELLDTGYGYDFEAEICVVLGDTPQGVEAKEAHRYVRLLLLANDISLRNLIPQELAKGFGFFVSKPASAFSPLAVTPDELGACWRDGRLHLPLRTHLNGELCGDPEAGEEMHFSFYDLIAHITQTRAFTAGTILGSGTVSNASPDRGASCLQEVRTRETIASGKPQTPFLKTGDRIEIEMLDKNARSIFGKISQRCVPVAR